MSEFLCFVHRRFLMREIDVINVMISFGTESSEFRTVFEAALDIRI